MSTLTTHQQKVFDNIISSVEYALEGLLKSDNPAYYMLSLSGAAGTGKTYLSAKLAHYFNRKNYDLTLTSPTHKATSVSAEFLLTHNIKATCKTIHSFLAIKPKLDYDSGVEHFVVDKGAKKDSTKILFVDESSMIGEELFGYIVEAIRDERVGFVVFIGDSFQLPPVSAAASGVFGLQNSFTLDEVVRQARDSYILRAATTLRVMIEKDEFVPLKKVFESFDGVEIFNSLELFVEDFCKGEKWYEDDKILTTYTNKSVNALNKSIRDRFWQTQGVSEPEFIRVGDNLRFDDAYSINDMQIYHNGEIVKVKNSELCKDNRLGIEYFKCEIEGSKFAIKVVDINSQERYKNELQAIADEANKAKYPKKSQLWDTYYSIKNSYANVSYTFASTIHKLQGSTYDSVYVDIGSLAKMWGLDEQMKYRLAYVAITRARKDVKVLL
ncbi:MAG: AAA family ATPase [Sulfurimonas sp.]|jgi:hypothetical protein|nr:AAA family ATPase [Sulfurimonadaceae bacterium]